ncbi:MAG: SRPBCC family protein [Flavobacteriaceae bacterium]
MTILLYILIGIVLLVLLLGAIAPKNYEVSRSVVINKGRKDIFPHLKFLKKQEAWSPWAKRDPNMERKFTGTDGEVGAISYWNGNKEVGEGEQELTKVVDNELVESQLRFLKPWKSQSDAFIKAEDAGANATMVTWGFRGKNKFPMSIMMLFMNMDKMIGKDFEEGLQSLKEQMEA